MIFLQYYAISVISVVAAKYAILVHNKSTLNRWTLFYTSETYLLSQLKLLTKGRYDHRNIDVTKV